MHRALVHPNDILNTFMRSIERDYEAMTLWHSYKYLSVVTFEHMRIRMNYGGCKCNFHHTGNRGRHWIDQVLNNLVCRSTYLIHLKNLPIQNSLVSANKLLRPLKTTPKSGCVVPVFAFLEYLKLSQMGVQDDPISSFVI